ncbi:hypothetical protein GGH12_000881 [Coemansia sp. RSA 1822]|nr:hypothetical protein LPJ76_000427 [Coemansia sp. RSA 638]KAJ2123248.1 hypothetical protein IW147_002778 [Coemansia sp. RSA 720]KAJ2541018.1 hypothetical protein GGF49_003991 [Coemansia sp. RSA 1853]KAJ2566331.1 hypothetical protein GGH12_000881 [Coemansia sp. RSA 1822]
MSSVGACRLFTRVAASFTLRAPVRGFQTTRASLQETTTATASPASTKWSPQTVELVNRLRDQQKYYATVIIKGRPFTVTQNDIVVMDRIKDLELGDSLALNQVTELGSRDYTIKGQPFVNPGMFKIEATVIEHPDGKQFTVTKKKQRTAGQKTTFHRNHHTMLRISLIDVNSIKA